jgi:hypothetical protein
MGWVKKKTIARSPKKPTLANPHQPNPEPRRASLSEPLSTIRAVPEASVAAGESHEQVVQGHARGYA